MNALRRNVNFSSIFCFYILFLLSLSSACAASADSFWCKQFGLFCPPKIAPWVPTYVTPTPTVNNGFGVSVAANPYYFATQETANKVCSLLSCAFVASQPCEMGGGPANCSSPELILVWKDGFTENAGLMASYWTNNPDSGSTAGVALSHALAQIAQDRTALGRPQVQSLSNVTIMGQVQPEIEPEEHYAGFDHVADLFSELRWI